MCVKTLNNNLLKTKGSLMFLSTTHPKLEVPLLELSCDVLHISNVPRAFHDGFQVLGSPADLRKEGTSIGSKMSPRIDRRIGRFRYDTVDTLEYIS